MGFELEQADGKWNWTIDREVPYWNPPPYFNIPLFEHISPNGGNNINGYGEYVQNIVANNGSGIQIVTDNPCSENPNDFFITGDALGDGLDGFNFSYDEIFSPYSNPNTSPCVNPEINSGLTMRIMNQDINGNITIRIYFDDNLALQECPPSKPKNLKVVPLEINPYTHAFNPKLTWDKNIEPDFIDAYGTQVPPARYAIYRGSSEDCYTEPAVYTMIDVVTSNIIEYTDNSVLLYPYNSGSVGCQYQFISYSYKISAIDYLNYQSLLSERDIINGYLNPCFESDRLILPETNNPKSFSVYNYPNPFNPSTEIRYSVPFKEKVTIKIYDLLGRLIQTLVDEYKDVGYYSVKFDGTNLASGVYLYRIEAGNFVQSKKMLLIK